MNVLLLLSLTYICVCHRAREMEFLTMSLQNSSSVLLKKSHPTF